MLFILIYLISFIFALIKFCDFKSAYRSTSLVGIISIIMIIICTYCQSNLPQVKAMTMETNIYPATDVNKETIVYQDDKGFLHVVNKDDAKLITTDKLKQCIVTENEKSILGRLCFLGSIPRNLTAYLTHMDM